MRQLLTICSFLLLATVACAQDRYDSVIHSDHVLPMLGASNRYCSKFSEARAITIQKRIEDCIYFYGKQFPKVWFDIRVFVLDENDWKLLPGGLPYGMPFSDSNNIVIPASKASIASLFRLGDDPEAAVDVDNIVLHELGHTFFTLNKLEIQQKWANEFLASYFAICYLRATGSTKDFPRIDETDFKPTCKSLKDFDSLYFNVGFQNYAWYEGKFIQLGYSLYPELKTDLIREFIKSYTANKNTDAIALIRKMSPVKFKRWLSQMQ